MAQAEPVKVTNATRMEDELLSICWKNHQSTFSQIISSLRQKERYSDATIACDGKFYPVHKLVLSICSEYFDAMLEHTPCKHPIIILRDVLPKDLEALLIYMYEGIVSISRNDLARLLKTAKMLRIKGLAVVDDLNLNDGQRVASVAISLPITATRTTREVIGSPQPKRRREERFHHSNSPSSEKVSLLSNQEQHYDRHGRPCKVEIHSEELKEIFQSSEVLVSTDGIVKEEYTMDDGDDLQNIMATATLGSTYGAVLSDRSTDTLVSHDADPDQVISHRYEPAQLAPGTDQDHLQQLAKAVAESLVGQYGMPPENPTIIENVSETTGGGNTNNNTQSTPQKEDDYIGAQQMMVRSESTTENEFPQKSSTSKRKRRRTLSSQKEKSAKRILDYTHSDNDNNSLSSDEDLGNRELEVGIEASDEPSPIQSSKEKGFCGLAQVSNADDVKNMLFKFQESVESFHKRLDELNKRSQDNSQKLDKLCRSNRTFESASAPTTFTVARTPKELDDLSSHSDIVPYLLHAAGSTLTRTIANMAKMLMSRELAMRFSLTGLGNKRTNSKLEFRKTSAYKVIEHALYQIEEFKSTTRKEFQTAIGVVLKNSVDWHGQRNKRSKNSCARSEFLQESGEAAGSSFPQSQNDGILEGPET